MLQWLREMLAVPAPDFPDFPAALAFMLLLEPDDAAQLEARAAGLEGELARITGGMASGPDFLPRIVLIEDEYRIAVLSAELAWVRQVIGELRDGRLDWTQEQLRELAAQTSEPVQRAQSEA
jgi:hypothetical protein